MGRFECHSHTMYSNLRLLDCINRPKDLIDRAIELNLSGICITDHECLSSHVELDRLIQEYKETNPSFKIARGNEIYLIDERGQNQQYWHFILIAKNAIGHKMLRELSSTAWINSYYDRGMERVPTLKSELKQIIQKYGKGNLISLTACLGSEIDGLILELCKARRIGDKNTEQKSYQKIVTFIAWCKELFDDDFYLEVQPSQSEEQMTVNQMMKNISAAFGVKIIVTTDAHYLTKEDRWIHKAYLNSKGGEREVDDFYAAAYLQSTEEVIENLQGTGLDYQELEDNTLEIYNKIEDYSLARKQHVPQPDLKEVKVTYSDLGYEHLDQLIHSDDNVDRYWVQTCLDKLKELNLFNDTYLSRLDEEADIKQTVGNKLETNMFAYPVFLKQLIDLFWECGSAVGCGRGSASGGLNHYLLGITQVDPIVNSLPMWRYMNKDTKELGDIDLDLCPSKREDIFAAIREQRGQLGCVQVCTFSTESTKSAILTACRGYRSEEYPMGIDNDVAQYIASLVPSERGFLWPIHDVIYGNEEKGRKPNKNFISEMNKFPGLLDIIQAIEGLVKARSIHASGVNFYGKDPFETACFMKATNGAIITQYSLHDAEFCGDTKYDMLVTEEMDIITQCLLLLQENGYIEKDLTLRQAYNKYIHPDKLPLDDDKLWDAIDTGDILALFQLTSTVGNNMVKKLKPRNVEMLTACNALIRLMPEGLDETPGDRYLRFKADISQWYAEMDACGLTKEEQKTLEKYCLADFGVPSSQEAAMLLFMDKDICGFTLGEANDARRIISKKKMDKIPELRDKVLSKAKSHNLGKYVWDKIISLQMGYSFKNWAS